MSLEKKGRPVELSREGKRTALACVPHLIELAKARKRITYKDLSKKVGARHWRPMNMWLGFVRDKLCLPNGFPIITALVVNGTTGLPGPSFLPGGTAHLKGEAYRREAEKVQEGVFDYPGWDKVEKVAWGMRTALN